MTPFVSLSFRWFKRKILKEIKLKRARLTMKFRMLEIRNFLARDKGGNLCSFSCRRSWLVEQKYDLCDRVQKLQMLFFVSHREDISFLNCIELLLRWKTRSFLLLFSLFVLHIVLFKRRKYEGMKKLENLFSLIR